MRTFLILLCLSSSASGALMTGRVDFPFSEGPYDVAVELRTTDGRFVRWEHFDVSLSATNVWTVDGVTEDTAVANGFDWSTWEAAILNPEYNTLRFYLDGAWGEAPFPQHSERTTAFQNLDRVNHAIVRRLLPPVDPDIDLPTPYLRVSFSSADYVVAPEPATVMLLALVLLVGLLHVMGCRNTARR